MGKRREDYPEWAKKYVKKGVTLRAKGADTFAVIKVASKWSKEKGYPVVSQEYLGVVKKGEGFLPAKSKINSKAKVYEYGLSNFIYSNFSSRLKRYLFNASREDLDTIVRLGIIKYVFGDLTEEIIKSSSLSFSCEGLLIDKFRKLANYKYDRIASGIDSCLREAIKDERDLANLKAYLRLSIVTYRAVPKHGEYPAEANEILERNGLRK